MMHVLRHGLVLLALLLGVACAAPRPQPAPPDNRRSPIGMNLGPWVDYSTSQPFVDLFRTARPFDPGLDLDEHGWVRSLRPGQTARTYLAWELNGAYPGGHYHVFYDGKGRLAYGGAARRLTHAPGHDVIAVRAREGGFWIEIKRTDPKDYIRNIRVIMPGGTCRGDRTVWAQGADDCPPGEYLSFAEHYDEVRYNPAFLRFLRPFSVLRFMDTMRTNGSPVREWADRARVEDATWSTAAGAPLEIMVDLANRLHADPWFTLPHAASDDYVRRFARYVRDHLAPDRKVYIEYSNETWNGQFPQFRYMIEQGQARHLPGDRYQQGTEYYSERAVEIFRIFEDEFGGHQRLVRVLASQAANAWLADVILSHRDAYKHADALAIAPYFGHYLGDPQAGTDQWSLARLFRELRGKALREAIGWMRAHAKVARKYGVDLIAYEGGQHLAGFGGAENNERLTRLFQRANRSPLMRPVYAHYFDAWKAAGGKLFVYYAAPGKYTKWGSWGIAETLSQPRSQAPKLDAVLTFIEENPRWWD